MNPSKEELASSFHKLDSTTQQILCGWIRTNLMLADEPLWSHSSYALKHGFGDATGLYVDNNCFKYAMLELGFEPIDEAEENSNYRIDKNSIGLKYRCV